MAWVSLDEHGNALHLAWSRDQIADAEASDLVEISDELAREVLEGRRSIACCSRPRPILPRSSTPRRQTIRYPSQMSEQDIDALINMARMIPSDGICVEIGSLFGGSAKAICEHAPNIKKLYCIDTSWALHTPCGADADVADLVGRFDLDPNMTYWQHASKLLAPHAAVIRMFPKRSPYDLSWWSEPIDFIFEDSNHTNPEFRDNLDFWWQHLRSGGIYGGHDFNPVWPDVYSEVQDLARRNNVNLEYQDCIWWCRKP